ncbi:four helix bundle protein [Mucilaginibacter calamicampi]|uniref:Four helix bundle protein n=1 Tax=Mucilaginibacter calamicampi TaxID=1302352 RepID=A0ABW2Z3U9_9SPHI
MEKISKNEFAEKFRERTKKFVVDNIHLYQSLPKTEEAKIVGRQLLRSSSSVGSNYRAACRSRSQAEFHSKISIVVEEADESVFWMEVMIEANIIASEKIERLMGEGNEILKVAASARKTVSENKK